MIRSDRDFDRHMDYVHWNPIKHGWVKRVDEWQHSSFHAYAQRGTFPADWAYEPHGATNGRE